MNRRYNEWNEVLQEVACRRENRGLLSDSWSSAIATAFGASVLVVIAAGLATTTGRELVSRIGRGLRAISGPIGLPLLLGSIAAGAMVAMHKSVSKDEPSQVDRLWEAEKQFRELQQLRDLNPDAVDAEVERLIEELASE